jgi:hypothetical protein
MNKGILALALLLNTMTAHAAAPVMESCYGTIIFTGKPTIGVDGNAIEAYIHKAYRFMQLLNDDGAGGDVTWGLEYVVKIQGVPSAGSTYRDELAFELNDLAKPDVGLSIKRTVNVLGCARTTLN